jgi:ribonuclease VapC
VIVDSSAIVAVLKGEPEAAACMTAINTAPVCRLSAATFLEAAIVVDGSRERYLSRRFDELVRDSELVIEAVTEEQARIARQAYRDFGKGSGHPAGLNFGDCFAYALAVDKREPLLFKGNGFRCTDVRPAIP